MSTATGFIILVLLCAGIIALVSIGAVVALLWENYRTMLKVRRGAEARRRWRQP